MKESKETSPAYMIAIAVIAVVLLAWFGYKTLSGPSYPAIPTMKQTYQTIDDMARRTQGDFSKLSPKEQDDLNSFARGHGKEYLSDRYKVITTGANK